MADIATLGLRIDSSQVDPATQKLERLSNAAKRAQAASDGVGTSTKNAGKVVKAANSNWETYDETVARVGIKTKQTGAATKAATAAVNGQAVAVSNAAKRADVATRSYGAFAAVLRTVSGIVGNFVINAITVAIGVLLAEMGKLVNWAGLAVWALNSLADAIEIIAPYAAMAAAGLALVYAPAIIGGIVSLIGLIGQLSLAALGLAASFAAANPAAAFVLGITAAVAAANIFRDELAQIFGIDIVGAAKTGVNYIIGSFFAAYEDIKFLWNNFPAIIGAAAVGAANATISAIEQMINGATSLLNGFIEKVNGALSMLPGGLSIGTIGSVDFGQIANPYADALAGAVGGRNAAVQGALSRDYLGEFGGAIAKGASAAADKLRGLAGSFGGVEGAAGKAGGAAKGAADKAKDAWKGLREETDKTNSAFNEAGKGAGGIIRGLIDGTLSWKDALQQAVQVAMKLFQSMNGGKGLFGNGLVGGLISGIFGFAKGGIAAYGKPLKTYASGGVSNTAAIFGEAGPEAAVPLPDGRNIPVKIKGGTSTVVNIGDTQIVVQGSADEKTLGQMKQMLAENNNQLVKQIPKMVDQRTDARQTRRVRA